MSTQTDPATLNRDPLGWLDARFGGGAGAAWGPGRRLYLADAEASRHVLRNAEGLFEPHSDFFGSGSEALPRAAQIDVGFEARALFEAQIARPGLLEDAVARLPARSDWPDAGNTLLLDLARPVIVRPSRPRDLQNLIDAVVRRRVRATARSRTPALTRMGLRFRLHLAIAKAREAPVRSGPDADVLDVVLRHVRPETPTEQVMELYLSFLFAMTGSVAFALSWALQLALAHGKAACVPAHIVTEALRLFPVAWLLERRPAREQQILGETVTPADHVVVCPYAVHRNPRHWEDPTRFQPERWRDRSDHSAWIPFGFGPHTCVASALSVDLAARLLGLILARGDAAAVLRGARPHLGAALAPPRFVLTLANAREGTIP